MTKIHGNNTWEDHESIWKSSVRKTCGAITRDQNKKNRSLPHEVFTSTQCIHHGYSILTPSPLTLPLGGGVDGVSRAGLRAPPWPWLKRLNWKPAADWLQLLKVMQPRRWLDGDRDVCFTRISRVLAHANTGDMVTVITLHTQGERHGNISFEGGSHQRLFVRARQRQHAARMFVMISGGKQYRYLPWKVPIPKSFCSIYCYLERLYVC